MQKKIPLLSLAAMLLFTGTAMAQTKVVVVPLGGKKPAGDAVVADVLEGKTFSNKDEVGIDGGMVNYGARTFTPGTADQTIPEGYHNGSGTVQGDADLLPGNIKSGASIFGVGGTSIETGGTATADQVLAGQTFSNASGAATGSMTNMGAQTITPGTSEQPITLGYHNGSGSVDGDADLVSGNIRSGVALFGVSGTSIEASGTATTDQVLAGQTFSNASGAATGSMTNMGAQTITPGTSEQPITQGYHNGSGSVDGDADLVSGNIRSGASLFGVDGDVNVVNTGSGDAAAGDLLSAKTAWVDGGEVTGSMTNVGAQAITPGTSAQLITQGYHNGLGSVDGDADLLAQNITSGTTIFGVTGTFMPPVAEGTVTSAGQVWMNRNLGASRAAISSTDTYAYGDLYQWGRLADGHQSRTSLTTWTLSTTDVPGHGSFIKISSAPYDWRTPQNHNLWQGVSGVNNPCPAGFRLPTGAEWEIERASWSSNNSAGAFASPLQLVPAGWRSSGYGALGVVGSYGYYWSSTVNGGNSGELLFSSIESSMMYYDRANGNSVRCLKD